MEVLRDISAHLRGDRPPLIPDPVTFTALLHPDEVEPFINEMTADGWSTWERLPPMNVMGAGPVPPHRRQVPVAGRFLPRTLTRHLTVHGCRCMVFT
jgi:hypothetical protein